MKKLILRTDRPEFAGVIVDRSSRQLILQWFARTDVRNVTYVSLLIFRFGWPPVRWISIFTNNDEPERREE